MIWLYRVLLNLAIPIGLIGLFVKGFRNSAYWFRWSERFGFVGESVLESGPYDLWVHAVSVGEARAAAPLINELKKIKPQSKILVTTTTPTGSAMVDMLLADKVHHCYFPYDLRWAMQRFISSTKPKTALIMETEIWPNMIDVTKRSGTKLIYTNVRLSEKSYRGYAKFPKLVSHTLSKVDLYAVQGAADRKHLQFLGVDEDKIVETGSIKFDVNIAPSLRESAEVLRRRLGQDRLIWIAGSTRDGEESIILAAYKELKRQYPSLLLILVPRHPERFDYMARKIQRRDLVCVRRTDDLSELSSDVDVYLGDTMGELSLMYACSDVAFVGGSLVPLGGQNILEPCALGVPVLFGPYMFNFPDISKWTIKEGAGRMVNDAQALVENVAELLANPSLRDEIGGKGMRFVDRHRGALAKNVELLKPHI